VKASTSVIRATPQRGFAMHFTSGLQRHNSVWPTINHCHSTSSRHLHKTRCSARCGQSLLSAYALPYSQPVPDYWCVCNPANARSSCENHSRLCLRNVECSAGYTFRLTRMRSGRIARSEESSCGPLNPACALPCCLSRSDYQFVSPSTSASNSCRTVAGLRMSSGPAFDVRDLPAFAHVHRHHHRERDIACCRYC